MLVVYLVILWKWKSISYLFIQTFLFLVFINNFKYILVSFFNRLISKKRFLENSLGNFFVFFLSNFYFGKKSLKEEIIWPEKRVFLHFYLFICFNCLQLSFTKRIPLLVFYALVIHIKFTFLFDY